MGTALSTRLSISNSYRPTVRRAHWARALIALGVVSLAGCTDQSPTDHGSASGALTTVSAGEQFNLRLQSIGPGEYKSPPAISQPWLPFLRVALVGPNVPAGVTQEFTFKAKAPGRVLVTFTHTGISATVVDTVDIR